MIRHTLASKRTVFLGCLLCSLILLLMPHSLTSKLQFTFQRVFHVPLRLSRSVTLSALTPPRQIDVSPDELQQLRTQHQQLENHVANLRALLRQQQKDIEQLAQLRLQGQWQRLSFVPADIITAAGDDQLLINRGSADTLKNKYFVLANNAIVGRIQELTSYAAKMSLVSDRASLLHVYIGSPETEGILQGLGQGRLAVNNVPHTKPIEPGLPVYVCKDAGFLEMPIIVGTISSCQRDEHDPLLWKIQVKPATDLTHLRRVDVIVAGQS